MTADARRGTRRSNHRVRGLRSKALMIVDFVCDYVERAGTITGGRGKRVLMLNGGSLNMRTGMMTPHVETMVGDVMKILAGTGTYRRPAPSNVGRALPKAVDHSPHGASKP